jgi:transposase
VKRAVASRRAERQGRYDQVVSLRQQGLSVHQVAHQLGMSERTVRHWLQRGTAPDVRPRRKYHSDFDVYAPYVLQRWQQGCHQGTQLWREIAAQGYPGSSRMVYRFLQTLKTTQLVRGKEAQRLPQYPSQAAIWLFIRRFKDLDEKEQNDLAAFRQASSTLASTYYLVQDFLQMVRERQGDHLEEWLTQVEKSALPELERFAHGVRQDQAGLTLGINNGQVEGHITKIKLIKRMMYGRASFSLLRQRILQAL